MNEDHPYLAERAYLMEAIREAFHDPTPPRRPDSFEAFTDDIRAPNYAEAIEETERFWGKDWSELSLEDFDACSFVFSFLTPDAVPYFLGAFMYLSTKEASFDHLVLDFLLLRPPGKKKARDLAFMKMSALWRICSEGTPAQRRALIRFLNLAQKFEGVDREALEFTSRVLSGDFPGAAQ